MTENAQVNVEIVVATAKAQGYSIVESVGKNGERIPSTAERAARRGLRWVKQPRNLRRRPPSHIARKLQLIKVTK